MMKENKMNGSGVNNYVNKKPTQAEKAMFEKYGLYLVFKDEDSYKYAPVHLKDGYTYSPSIEVEDNMVEWEHAIVFDMFTETVTLNNSFDFMYINVICDRMKELNFID